MKQRKNLGESLEENQEEEIKEYPLLKSVILTVLGLGVVVGGSSVAVYSAKELARIIGLTERIIALTVVSFGTALPEMFTSVKASIKGNVDIAVGNILGSNIFNLLFILGITSMISPIAFSIDFFIDVGIAIATIILLLTLIVRKKRLGRVGGIIALSTYAIYFVYILLAI
jgi:cation:H+ antiporter